MRFERVLIYLPYGVTITAYFVSYSGRIVAALMHVRAVQGMTLFRPSTVTDVFAFSKCVNLCHVSVGTHKFKSAVLVSAVPFQKATSKKTRTYKGVNYWPGFLRVY